MVWYQTKEGYSAGYDNTAKGEYCDSLCQNNECCGNCDNCRVYN